jgi:triacylglycerol lipase
VSPTSSTLPNLGSSYTPAQIMMTLSAFAYADPGDIATNFLADPSYATQGLWSLVWGPCVTPDTAANLVYVAQYKGGSDVVYAVVIRGTVLTFSLATLVDLYEDLDVGTQDAWDYPAVPGAAVANGTMYGLNALTQLSSNDTTLLDFLAQLPAGCLFVTGHSLGGCLTSVLAPWLQYQLSLLKSGLYVVPFTFAAPTAGNAAFADWYTQSFSAGSWRYCNTIDMVPMAWNNLSEIKNLFSAPGPSCPLAMEGVIDMVNGWLNDVDQVSYAQTNGPGTPLANQPTAMTDWFSEVGLQHSHLTYLAILNAPQGSIPSATQVKPKHLLPQRG